MSYPRHVRTQRLMLRAFEDDDAELFRAIHADPEFWYFPLKRGMTAEETEAFVETRLRNWQDRGWDLWVCEWIQTGAIVGWLGLSVPEFLPEVMPAVEVAWRLHPHWWGKGVAVEGAGAALDAGFEHLELDRIIAIVDSENEKSIATAERLGLTLDHDTEHPEYRIALQVFATSADEWKARRSGPAQQ